MGLSNSFLEDLKFMTNFASQFLFQYFIGFIYLPWMTLHCQVCYTERENMHFNENNNKSVRN